MSCSPFALVDAMRIVLTQLFGAPTCRLFGLASCQFFHLWAEPADGGQGGDRSAHSKDESPHFVGRRARGSVNMHASDEHLSSHQQTPPNGAASAPRILTRGLGGAANPKSTGELSRTRRSLRFVRSPEFMLSVDQR